MKISRVFPQANLTIIWYSIKLSSDGWLLNHSINFQNYNCLLDYYNLWWYHVGLFAFMFLHRDIVWKKELVGTWRNIWSSLYMSSIVHFYGKEIVYSCALKLLSKIIFMSIIQQLEPGQIATARKKHLEQYHNWSCA